MGHSAKSRNNERGVTMVLVAVALVSILAMAALAVDVLALYVARSEAQRAADAAALAAAKMFAFTGYTSNQSAITQAELCVSGGAGNTAAANAAAETVISQNKVAGQAATLQSITCNFNNPENPTVTINVQRTGLPILFGRIWATAASSVSATASAEAFNPSGGTVNMAVGSVKPWLLANDCPGGCGGPFYFNAGYGIANPNVLIGQPQHFTMLDARNDQLPNGASQFYALNPPAPNYCPSNGALNCNQIGTGPPNVFYHDNIACSNTAFQYSCGQQISDGGPVKIDVRPAGSIQVRTQAGVECLIHANSAGPFQGQDTINAGTPVTIDGGTNNPNAALQGATNISRSDSVVTVPVYGGGDPGCSSSGCTNTLTVIGFLQLGIQDVDATGNIDAVILNASGCNPANTGTPVAGGAVTPIPVRLIHQ
jgi:Tfp pilus assembly protein PilE